VICVVRLELAAVALSRPSERRVSWYKFPSTICTPPSSHQQHQHQPQTATSIGLNIFSGHPLAGLTLLTHKLLPLTPLRLSATLHHVRLQTRYACTILVFNNLLANRHSPDGRKERVQFDKITGKLFPHSPQPATANTAASSCITTLLRTRS